MKRGNSGSSGWAALYTRLAQAFPQEFQMRYGADLERAGQDAIPEIRRRYGTRGLLRLIADIALRLPATWLEEIRQDAGYALRRLAKSPGFAAVAVLSLALGIGMCCAVFSEFRAIGGPPAGVRDPGALFTSLSGVSYPYFERYREQRRAAAAAAVMLGPAPFAVAFSPEKGTHAERIYGHLVSPEYFSTLGVTAALGRVFDAGTDKPGMPPGVVVSDRFWRSHLGADPLAVGRKLRINSRAATIVGVGPKDFLGIWPGQPADLFLALTTAGGIAPELAGDPLHRPTAEIFRLLVRVPRGVKSGTAEAALNVSARILDRENGVQADRERGGKLVKLIPAGTVLLMRPQQHAFIDTLNAVLWALVLSLVCANLAGLLLARASRRRAEVAVRLSVGASRARLVRQFLTESVLLALAGGLLGVLLAFGITRVLSSLPISLSTPIEWHCQPDLKILAITMAIAAAAGIGFGLAPALAAARIEIAPTLKPGAQAPLRGYRRLGMRNLFVLCQMATALLLLLVTGDLTAEFLKNGRIDPGYETGNLSLLALDPVRDGFSAARTAALYDALPGELSGAAGVRAVSLAHSAPLASLAADQPNTHVRAGQREHAVFGDFIGAGYFAAVGVPLAGGREFDRRDCEDAQPGAAMLNQTAARALFSAEDPIGRAIRQDDRSYTVIGVTRDIPAGFLNTTKLARVFFPLTGSRIRSSPAESLTVLVRGSGGPGAVRQRLESLHPDLTVFNIRTMREDLDRLNSFEEWENSIYEALGVFALLLASIGLGGVTAYAVARRQKEIGIRMALGARRRQVEALVMKEGVALAAAGTAIGCAGAFALMRALASYSDIMAKAFGTRLDDPLLLAVPPVVLGGLAMLACYLPARRAARIDPNQALRGE